MTEAAAAHARDVGDYLALVRRRRGWIAGAVLIGLGLASGYLMTAEKTYVSTAKVLVRDTGTDAGDAVGARTNESINLDTEAQLVRSEPVSERAAEILASPLSLSQLSHRVTVTVPPNTTVMDISFAAPSADEAQAGASAFAKAYLENRRDVAEGALAGDIARLRDQIEGTSEQIQDTSVAIARLTRARDRDDRAFLVARRGTLSSQLGSLNAALAPLVAKVVDAGQVITEAQEPRTPVDPNPFLVLPTGLMVGLLAGLGLAAWRERVDKRVHSGRDVERLFGIVPLSTVRTGPHGNHTRVVHDVRALYHSLRARAGGSQATVMLVGPDAPDTAENLSFALALVAVRTGATTAYVGRADATVAALRRRSEAEKRGALQVLDYEALGVMEDDEVRAASLVEEVRELAGHRDFVVLGMPNEDPAVDVPLLGRHVDVGVLVVRLGQTRRDTLGAVLGDLTKSGVDQVLLVIVDLGRRGLRRRQVEASEAFAEATHQAGPLALPLQGTGRVAVARPDDDTPRTTVVSRPR